MVKCIQCGATLEETFLNKKLGTMQKKDGKRVWVCSACQSKVN